MIRLIENRLDKGGAFPIKIAALDKTSTDYDPFAGLHLRKRRE